MQFKVVVFTDKAEIFKKQQAELAVLGCPGDCVLWGDSSSLTRAELINLNVGSGCFFLDHDCKPDAAALALAHRLFDERTADFVAAGVYLNPENATLLQRVHNFVANGWLEHSYLSSDSHGFLLGGVFLIRISKPLKPQVSELFWGAEDKALAKNLRENGIVMVYTPELRVVHDTNKSFVHFLRRAWLHGINDVKHIKGGKEKTNFLFWLQRVDSANLDLIPLTLLHFCIQKTALLFQTIRQGNK